MAKPNKTGGQIERFAPGVPITCTAAEAIDGGQLVTISGNREVSVAGDGDIALGLAMYDADVDEGVSVACPNAGGVWLLTAAEALDAGVEVTADTDGAIKEASSGDPVIGLTLESAAEGATPEVLIYFSRGGA